MQPSTVSRSGKVPAPADHAETLGADRSFHASPSTMIVPNRRTFPVPRAALRRLSGS
jgi:hypothetical protein